MFSTALFKQSCKANGIMWAIITFAVCFMLACVMMIAGGGNIGTIRSGITNTIIESSVEAQAKTRASTYYSIVTPGLKQFDETFAAAYAQKYTEIKTADPSVPDETASAQAGAYALNTGVGVVNVYINDVCTKNGYEDGSVEKQELQGLMFACFNLDMNGDGTADFDYFYDAYGADVKPYTTLLSTVSSPNRDTERKEYARNYCSVFFAGNMVSEDNVDKLVVQLEKFKISKEGYQNLTYTNKAGEEVSKYTGTSGYLYIKDLATDTIVTLQARLDYEIAKIETTDPVEYQKEVARITNEIIAENGKTFLSSLPEDVSTSLQEVGQLDIFGMITGSVYFKMAGLLLPIIYIIMVSNNLIAGQVDTGSMAYVLSTSTKRKQVTFTQSIYLILSLFVMFACVTITGMVCLACLNSSMVTISYYELGMLSLGAFITLFAMSGISFLASCWFNRSKHSMSIGGGINMFFLVATMLGLFGSKVLPSIVRLNSLNFFNYCSIISLFDEVSILEGTTTFIWKLAILAVIGIVCYIVGAIKFEKKDLPL